MIDAPDMHQSEVLGLAREARSSIEVSRDAKGVYRWDIKLYFDRQDGDELPTIIQLSRIDDELRRLFIPKDGAS